MPLCLIFFLFQPILPPNKQHFFFLNGGLLVTNGNDRYEFASPASHWLLSVNIVDEQGGSWEGIEEIETKNYGVVETTLTNGT